jgi:hypothetical protein
MDDPDRDDHSHFDKQVEYHKYKNVLHEKDMIDDGEFAAAAEAAAVEGGEQPSAESKAATPAAETKAAEPAADQKAGANV